MVQAPHLIDYIPAPGTGIWEPPWLPETMSARATSLGGCTIFRTTARHPVEVRAHKAGVIIAMYFAARCHKGLTLYVIGEDVKRA